MTEQEILMDIRERLVRVETQLIDIIRTGENYNKIESRVVELEACAKTTKQRVGVLEGHNTWLWRIVATAVVGALLSLIIKGG